MLPPEFSVLKNTVAVTLSNRSWSQEDRFARFSNWHKLRKTVAWILRLKDRLMKLKFEHGLITVSEIDRAEIAIIVHIQSCFLGDEKSQLLRMHGSVAKSSHVRKLKPVLFEGVLRVEGPIDRADVPFDAKHPAILPSENHVTRLINEQHHRDVGHAGMAQTRKPLCHKIQKETKKKTTNI